MQCRDELTQKELDKIRKLSEKYHKKYEDVELDYCLLACDSAFDELDKKYRLIRRYNQMGVRGESLIREIESMIHKINFYTRTINALIKVGWSPCGTDGVIAGFHNERALLINKAEQMADDVIVVKQNRNGKGLFKAYNRQAYIKKTERHLKKPATKELTV